EELMASVKQTTLEAYRHQAFPFDELAEALRSAGRQHRGALFDVMVVMQNAEVAGAADYHLPGGLKARGYSAIDTITSKFDLTFTFREVGDDLQMREEYDSDLFLPGSVERMADHLEQLLIAMLGSPLAPLSGLEYLGAAEKHRLLNEFNDTAAGYPSHETLVSLWEAQVDRTPSRTAVTFGGKAITYRELNEWSNRLGDHLRKVYHIQPGDRVGVLLPRSEWSIIAILGVLKSGGAYVPVDPLYPKERIEFMVADSGCKAVIDEDELDRFRDAVAEYSSGDVPPVNKPSDAAYVIYTSGTTG